MHIKSVSTLVIAFLTLGQAVVGALPARAASLEELPVALRLEGEVSMPGYFAAIEEHYRVSVACEGCPEAREPGQGRMDGPLRDVLGRIAERFGVTSYAVDFDEAKRVVSIRVLGLDPARQAAPSAAQTGEAGSATAAGAPATGLDTEVTPPEAPGQAGVTMREVASVSEKNQLRQAAVDPLDEIVIPPMAEGETGLTARQVNALHEQALARQERLDPLDQDATPPGGSGEPAVTHRQVEALRAKNGQQGDQGENLDAEIIPPDPDGKGALTKRQVNAIREKLGSATSVAEAGRPPSLEDEQAATPR